MLLAKGKIVYFNESRLAIDYFSSIGSQYSCPSWNNPADFFMDMLNIDSIDNEDDDGKLKPREAIEEEFN
jgi:ATP-binding cassette subfamily G (WHITE) protein 2